MTSVNWIIETDEAELFSSYFDIEQTIKDLNVPLKEIDVKVSQYKGLINRNTKDKFLQLTIQGEIIGYLAEGGKVQLYEKDIEKYLIDKWLMSVEETKDFEGIELVDSRLKWEEVELDKTYYPLVPPGEYQFFLAAVYNQPQCKPYVKEPAGPPELKEGYKFIRTGRFNDGIIRAPNPITLNSWEDYELQCKQKEEQERLEELNIIKQCIGWTIKDIDDKNQQIILTNGEEKTTISIKTIEKESLFFGTKSECYLKVGDYTLRPQKS